LPVSFSAQVIYRIASYRAFKTFYNYKLSITSKSPAVARVSRPYPRCTLAACVHNCPSI